MMRKRESKAHVNGTHNGCSLTKENMAQINMSDSARINLQIWQKVVNIYAYKR